LAHIYLSILFWDVTLEFTEVSGTHHHQHCIYKIENEKAANPAAFPPQTNSNLMMPARGES